MGLCVQVELLHSGTAPCSSLIARQTQSSAVKLTGGERPPLLRAEARLACVLSAARTGSSVQLVGLRLQRNFERSWQ